MSYHIFRDPIHGNIYLNLPHDQVLLDLIDSPEFQRLRRISQLGGIVLTYPGAEQSRFTHSLGVMHLMILALDHLRKISNDKIWLKHLEKYATTTKIAALLHDIGHGPFSHTFESLKAIKTYKHEAWTVQIIRKSPNISRILKKYKIDPEEVIKIIEKKCEQPIFHELLSGHLDVDRMDYLLRDSHATGVKYGEFDWQRLLTTLTPVAINDKYHLGLSEKAVHSLEEFILSRYFMYEQVYLHKKVLSTEFLIQSIFLRVFDLVAEEKIDIRHPVLAKLFNNKELDVHEFYELDDYLISTFFRSMSNNGDDILRDLCQRFLNRRLFKVVTLTKKDDLKDIKKYAKEQGFPPRYYVGELSAKLTPYPIYEETENSLADFPIVLENNIMSISEVSPIIKKFKGYSFRTSLCAYPEEIKN